MRLNLLDLLPKGVDKSLRAKVLSILTNDRTLANVSAVLPHRCHLKVEDREHYFQLLNILVRKIDE